MPFVNDGALDAALDYINNGDRLDICSQEPTSVAEARTTYSLGNKTSLSIGSPADGDSSGRKVVVAAITDGSVTSSGTASHWAISNSTVLIATDSLSSSQAVTSGNEFTLAEFDITFPDPT